MLYSLHDARGTLPFVCFRKDIAAFGAILVMLWSVPADAYCFCWNGTSFSHPSCCFEYADPSLSAANKVFQQNAII